MTTRAYPDGDRWIEPGARRGESGVRPLLHRAAVLSDAAGEGYRRLPVAAGVAPGPISAPLDDRLGEVIASTRPVRGRWTHRES
jgi:hypothetical protein